MRDQQIKLKRNGVPLAFRSGPRPKMTRPRGVWQHGSSISDSLVTSMTCNEALHWLPDRPRFRWQNWVFSYILILPLEEKVTALLPYSCRFQRAEQTKNSGPLLHLELSGVCRLRCIQTMVLKKLLRIWHRLAKCATTLCAQIFGLAQTLERQRQMLFQSHLQTPWCLMIANQNPCNTYCTRISCFPYSMCLFDRMLFALIATNIGF